MVFFLFVGSPLDNNYNYENVAMPRLMRIISELPRDIEVRSFYVETLSGRSAGVRSRRDQAQPRRGHSVPVQLRDSLSLRLQVLL